MKLHCKFAHPAPTKLIWLIINARSPWCNNLDLNREIKNILENCSTPKVYHKTTPRPVVGLPMAKNFFMIAMDTKFYNGNIFLHIIDHCAGLPASTIIPNKNPNILIKAIIKI